MEQVLQHALTRQPVPIVWEEDLKAVPAPGADDEAAGVVAH
jgi:ATP-dependent Lon protease